MSNRETHCPGCQRQFSSFIRPQQCEVCSKTFCSNCALQFAMGSPKKPKINNRSSLSISESTRLCSECSRRVSIGDHYHRYSSYSGEVKQSQQSSQQQPQRKHESSVKKLLMSCYRFIFCSNTTATATAQKSSSQSLCGCCGDCCCASHPFWLCGGGGGGGGDHIKPHITDNVSMSHLNEQTPIFPGNTWDSVNVVQCRGSTDPLRSTIEGEEAVRKHARDMDLQVMAQPELHRRSSSSFHPLNQLSLSAPKSVINISHNQVAINVSINKQSCEYYSVPLEISQPCQCSYSCYASDNANITECHQSVTISINDKRFVRMRIDLLFDDAAIVSMHRNKDSLITNDYLTYLSITLYTKDESLWTGGKFVNVSLIDESDHTLSRVITDFTVHCRSLQLRQSVVINGSISWKLQNSELCDSLLKDDRNYDLHSAISALTQDRNGLLSAVSQSSTPKASTLPSDEGGKSNLTNDLSTQSQSIPINEMKLDKRVSSDEDQEQCPLTLTQHSPQQSNSQPNVEMQNVDNMLSILRYIERSVNRKRIASECVDILTDEFDQTTLECNASEMLSVKELDKTREKIVNAAEKNNQKPVWNILETNSQNRTKLKEDSGAILSNFSEIRKDLTPVCVICYRCNGTLTLVEHV